VVNARIDGGREVFLVTGRLVKRRLDARAQLGGELRAAGIAEEVFPVQLTVHLS
jgi:hypothetical protein